MFYNHKVRIRDGRALHPVSWLERSQWTLRQEVVWDREATHNFEKRLFWQMDERIFWLTKGKPTLPDKPIGMSTVWRIWGPVPNTPHPAPFRIEIPSRCLAAVAVKGVVVLDPYAGSGTTLLAARQHGLCAIGIEADKRWCDLAADNLAQGVLFGAGASA